MKVRTLDCQQTLPLTMGEAWDFLSNPWNLPQITPPSLGFEILSDPPEVIYPGLIIQYKVSPFAGWKVRWVSEIRHIVPGEAFVDEQRSGPYAFWHHYHHLAPCDEGVVMTDRVHYALPFGLAGDWAAAWLVQRQLKEIFAFRTQVLEELFPRC